MLPPTQSLDDFSAKAREKRFFTKHCEIRVGVASLQTKLNFLALFDPDMCSRKSTVYESLNYLSSALFFRDKIGNILDSKA